MTHMLTVQVGLVILFEWCHCPTQIRWTHSMQCLLFWCQCHCIFLTGDLTPVWIGIGVACVGAPVLFAYIKKWVQTKEGQTLVLYFTVTSLFFSFATISAECQQKNMDSKQHYTANFSFCCCLFLVRIGAIRKICCFWISKELIWSVLPFKCNSYCHSTSLFVLQEAGNKSPKSPIRRWYWQQLSQESGHN